MQIKHTVMILALTLLSLGSNAAQDSTQQATSQSKEQPAQSNYVYDQMLNRLEAIKNAIGSYFNVPGMTDSDGDQDKAKSQPVTEKQAQEYYEQPPIDSRYYYELGGRAPIAPSSESIAAKLQGSSSQPMQDVLPNCAAFDQNKSLEQIIEQDIMKKFAAAYKVASKLKNSELYKLQASDPRLFNLATLALEMGMDKVENQLAECRALTENSSGGNGNLLNNSIHDLVAQNKIKVLQESLGKNPSSNGSQQSISLHDAMAKAHEIEQKPMAEQFKCPCNLACNTKHGEYKIIESAIACAYQAKTERLSPENSFKQLFVSPQQAGNMVAEIVGETSFSGHSGNNQQKSLMNSTVAKGLEHYYSQYAKANLTKLIESVKLANEMLSKGQSIPSSVVNSLSENKVGHIITADIITQLANDPAYTVKGQMAHIAYHRAFVETFYLARHTKQLLDAAMRLPNVDPVSLHYLKEAKKQLLEDVAFLNYEAEAARQASENLNIVIQKGKSDDLRGAVIDGYTGGSDTCWKDGAPVSCASIR